MNHPRPSRRALLGSAALAILAVAAGAGTAGTTPATAGSAWPTEFPLPDGRLPEGITIGSKPYAYTGSCANGVIHGTDPRTGEVGVLYAGAVRRPGNLRRHPNARRNRRRLPRSPRRQRPAPRRPALHGCRRAAPAPQAHGRPPRPGRSHRSRPRRLPSAWPRTRRGTARSHQPRRAPGDHPGAGPGRADPHPGGSRAGRLPLSGLAGRVPLTVAGAPSGSPATACLALRTAGSHREQVAAAAGFHGAYLATDAPDSPHLLADRITAELCFGHADQGATNPAEQIDRLDEALTSAGVRHRGEVYGGAHHGFTQAETAMHSARATERHWAARLDLFRRTL